MTDKQIIIDEIDVSGCLFFTQYGFCTAQLDILGGSGKCSVNNPNCYYKQLKRKEQECETLASQLDFEVQKKECLEQECERLKEERDTWHYQWEKRYEICESLSDDIDKLCEQLDQLKAENEELKNTVDYLRREFKNIKWTNKAISKQCENLNCKDLQKLKQTLTEIKDLCQKHIKAEKIVMANDILQKISECEGNNE